MKSLMSVTTCIKARSLFCYVDSDIQLAGELGGCTDYFAPIAAYYKIAGKG